MDNIIQHIWWSRWQQLAALHTRDGCHILSPRKWITISPSCWATHTNFTNAMRDQAAGFILFIKPQFAPYFKDSFGSCCTFYKYNIWIEYLKEIWAYNCPPGTVLPLHTPRQQWSHTHPQWYKYIYIPVGKCDVFNPLTASGTPFLNY